MDRFPLEVLSLFFDAIRGYKDLHLASRVCKSWADLVKKVIVKRVREEIMVTYVCESLYVAEDTSKAMNLCKISNILFEYSRLKRQGLLKDTDIENSLWCLQKTSYLFESKRRYGKTTMIMWMNILLRILQPDQSKIIIVMNGSRAQTRFLEDTKRITSLLDKHCKWDPLGPLTDPSSACLNGNYIMSFLELMDKPLERGMRYPDFIFVNEGFGIPNDILIYWINSGSCVYWFRTPCEEEFLNFNWDKDSEWNNINLKYINVTT